MVVCVWEGGEMGALDGGKSTVNESIEIDLGSRGCWRWLWGDGVGRMLLLLLRDVCSACGSVMLL